MLCDPMDYSLPGSSVHGPPQAKIPERVAIPFYKELNQGLLHFRQILYHLSHQGSPRILEWVAYSSPVDRPDSGIKPGSCALQADSLPAELPRKPSVYLEQWREWCCNKPPCTNHPSSTITNIFHYGFISNFPFFSGVLKENPRNLSVNMHLDRASPVDQW